MTRLLLSSVFQRDARRLADKGILDRQAIATALRLLAEDPLHPRLKTHKLRGEFEGHRACSLGYDLRIIFQFVEHEGERAILLETIGTHDEVS